MWIPVLIRSDYFKPVIFGGGKAACMKAGTLCSYGVESVMVCPHEPEGIDALEPRPIWISGTYEPLHLEGATLVIAATDDRELNRRICLEAGSRGVPALNAAEGLDGSICFQRAGSAGDITVSVFTGGLSPAAGAEILGELLTSVKNSQWPERVRLLGEIRTLLKQNEPDPTIRTLQLRALSTMNLEELRKRRCDYED